MVRTPDISPLVVGRRRLLGGAIGMMALAMSPALSGCSRGPGRAALPTGMRRLAADLPRTAIDAATAPHLAEVVAGMDDFGRDLHAATANAAANWTVSPLSIALAFGMLRAGARGRTAAQLDAAFGWPTGTTEGAPHQALGALSADLVSTDPLPPASGPTDAQNPPPPVVALANGLFVAADLAAGVRQEFLDLLATQYGADAAAVSFSDPSAVRLINEWVQTQTRGRIDRLFDSLDPATQLVLANAVYLKTTWASQFARADTKAGQFTTASGKVDAQLMRQTVSQAAYDETAEWQRIRLPYVGRELAMTVVLPRHVVRDVAGLSALLPRATELQVRGTALVDLVLPRWDTATTIPLLPALAGMGVTDLHDLTGIAPAIEVSAAIHRANVTVDEEGTEAAAVTGIAVVTSAIVATPVQMTVDRPFVWAVVHQPTGTPVFTGHVVDPTT